VTSESTPASETYDLPTQAPGGRIRWAAVIVAAVGWWISFDLARIGFGAGASNPLVSAACGADADRPSPCETVVSSPWGSVPISPQAGSLRIPVAAFGMGYFGFVGLWFLLIGCPSGSRKAWHLVPATVVAVGLLFSLEYVRVMASVLHQWCLGCTAVHVANAGLGVLTVWAYPWRREPIRTEPHPRNRLAISTFLAGTFLFLLHVTIAFVFVQNQSMARAVEVVRSITADPAYVRWHYERQDIHDIPVDVSRPLYGDPDAPHTVVVFLDFQCPVCRIAHGRLQELLERHPSRLRVSLRHFPLDRSCNPELGRSPHPLACAAARAVEAAFRVGGTPALRRMATRVYAEMEQLDPHGFRSLATDAGLNAAEFQEALEAVGTADAVRDDVALAHRLGVSVAPTLFLDGRKLDYWRSELTWETLLGLNDPKAKP
jgi:predicted DsbA family dithiol-disulfide isomerase